MRWKLVCSFTPVKNVRFPFMTRNYEYIHYRSFDILCYFTSLKNMLLATIFICESPLKDVCI